MKNKKYKMNSCEALQIIDGVKKPKARKNGDWRFKLHEGDEISIDSGEPYAPTPSVIIQSIQYFKNRPATVGGTTVRILTKDGEKIECFLKEIS
jgi:hypothetical protein